MLTVKDIEHARMMQELRDLYPWFPDVNNPADPVNALIECARTQRKQDQKYTGVLDEIGKTNPHGWETFTAEL